MDYNRYKPNRFRNDYQRTPYDRGPRPRQPYHGPRSNINMQRPNYNRHSYTNVERTFDHKGREIYGPQTSNYRERDNEVAPPIPQQTLLERKAKSFLDTVLGQEGIRSKLIFLESVNNALQTLQATVDYYQVQMTIEQNTVGEFVLAIDKEEVAKGTFPSKQLAKNALAEQALDILKKDCFYIIKKKEYEEVSTKADASKQELPSQSKFEGSSKAHQMMLKMGWGGKGLGVNEQGTEKTVADIIDQNVSRQGLGTDNVFKKIHKILEEYSKSDKMSLLKFDPDFTSEERAHIHKIANKFGLKSKSEGKGEQRRITITKKLHRGDLVYNLLNCGLENALYKLIIPNRFEYLWLNEDEEDNDYPYFSC